MTIEILRAPIVYPDLFPLFDMPHGEIIERPEDILREPYIFEFTGLPQLPVYKEGDLEEALVNNLSLFSLELGKGFTYVGRQQKMVIGGRTYKVDLVFYHRILKCFVLIDLTKNTGSDKESVFFCIFYEISLALFGAVRVSYPHIDLY